jgi:hypothetical protein
MIAIDNNIIIMNLNLSWDLFILAFFGVVIAYSFIIGRNKTLKVISATYIGILCSDALGNLFSIYFASSETFLKVLKLFSITTTEQAVAFFKVFILITLIVMLAVRGQYSFSAEDDRSIGLRTAITIMLGVMSAGLMMSAIMIFISGGSLIIDAAVLNNPINEIYSQARLVRVMVDYSNYWFFIPGITLVVLSVFNKKPE